MDVEDLPDFAALKKLASALWQKDGTFHGAAVIVGAGFSRCAARTGDRRMRMPLWHDLARTLGRDLGSSVSDPLRLAEEYRAYFGTQAMHDVLKTSVNDSAWTPGPLHEDLLRLPWTEVLTTNWDTLLERASLDVHERIYGVVRKQEDLASSRSPRVVKLHGTISVDQHLVFTQEDYRKYPVRYAAFVNFARQVFIENELCLIGFSGDDPNFLEWAGWVRDHLAGNVRRIYLVGALKLTAAKRKYLESLNVAPIDLADAVADHDDVDLQHAAATELFLAALNELKPKPLWAWHPAQTRTASLSLPDTNALVDGQVRTSLEEYSTTLQLERRAYPGWLVCPSLQRWEILTQSDSHSLSATILKRLPTSTRERILYELAWRYSRSYDFIDANLAELFHNLCLAEHGGDLSTQARMEVALLLLNSKRWVDVAGVDWPAVAQSIETSGKYWPEGIIELAYQRAISARDNLDYPELEKQIELILTDEPWWKIRKASLLVELGHFTEAENMVLAAYRELLALHRENKGSIFILSRLAWAHWLCHVLRLQNVDGTTPFPSIYQENKCSPWDILEQLNGLIISTVEGQQKRSGFEPLFLPGRYRDNSSSHSFTRQVHPLLVMAGISEKVGLPIRWGNTNLLVDHATRLVDVVGVEGRERYSLAVRAANSDTSEVINKVFSRIRIASMPSEEVEYLFVNCTHAVNYWVARAAGAKVRSRTHVLDRLRVLIEILGRVSVRLSSEEAKQLFSLGVELCRNRELQHLWLHDALDSLLKYSLASIPDQDQVELLQQALEIPLPSELVHFDQNWPNPVIRTPGIRSHNSVIDRRIDEVINAVAPDERSTTAALVRLLPLVEAEFLTAEENQKLVMQLWGADPHSTSLQVETRLFTHAQMELPCRNPALVEEKYRKYLFDASPSTIVDPSFLEDLIHTVQVIGSRITPDHMQAGRYFDILVAWRPTAEEGLSAALTGGGDRRKADLIGKALAYVIVPHLADAKKRRAFSRLLQFYEETGSPASILALVDFVDIPELAGKVERVIRLGLQDKNINPVAFSARAIAEWRLRSNGEAVQRLVALMVFLLGAQRLCELPAILESLQILQKMSLLTNVEVASVIDILPVVFDSAKYDAVSEFSREAASVSLVRAGCVRFARLLLDASGANSIELERLVSEARLDPLPEVRFA